MFFKVYDLFMETKPIFLGPCMKYLASRRQELMVLLKLQFHNQKRKEIEYQNHHVSKAKDGWS